MAACVAYFGGGLAGAAPTSGACLVSHPRALAVVGCVQDIALELEQRMHVCFVVARCHTWLLENVTLPALDSDRPLPVDATRFGGCWNCCEGGGLTLVVLPFHPSRSPFSSK